MRGNGGRGAPRQPNSGTLALVQAPNTGSGTNPRFIHIPKDGKHAYVGLVGTTSIAQYTIDPSGALIPFATRDLVVSGSVGYAASTSDGTGIFVSLQGSYALKPITRNTTDGSLTLGTGLYVDGTGSTPVGGQYPCDVLISPDDLFVYTVCRYPSGQGSVAQFSRNTSTNALTRLSPFGVNVGSAINWQPYGGAMTKLNNGAFFYTGNFGNNSISMFTRDTTTGQLSPNSVSASISTGASSNPAWMLTAPNAAGTADAHLYCVLDGTAKVACYTINSDGTLTAFATRDIATGNGPFSIQLSPDFSRLYIGNSDGQDISQYARDLTTGILTPLVPAKVRSDPLYTTTTGSAGPQVLAITPNGKSLYSSGSIAPNSISQFRINP